MRRRAIPTALGGRGPRPAAGAKRQAVVSHGAGARQREVTCAPPLAARLDPIEPSSARFTLRSATSAVVRAFQPHYG